MRKRTSDTDLIIGIEDGPNVASYVTNSYPIAAYVFDTDGYPELIGSGFFIIFDRALFFITAFHLVKELLISKMPFGIGCNFQIYPIHFKGAITNNDYAKHGKFDDTDIAAFAIRPEDRNYSLFRKCAIRHHQSIDGLYFDDGISYCYLTGFPISKNKKSRYAIDTSGGSLANYITYIYKLVDSSKLEMIDRDPLKFIGLQWVKKSILGGVVHPKGCSGAPVWFVKRNSSHMHIYLVGVYVEFFKRDKLFIFTRIEQVYELLAKHEDYWSELRVDEA